MSNLKSKPVISCCLMRLASGTDASSGLRLALEGDAFGLDLIREDTKQARFHVFRGNRQLLYRCLSGILVKKKRQTMKV